MASSGNYESKIAGGSTGGYYIGIDWKVNSQTTNPPKSNVTASVYVRSSGGGYSISSSTSKDISITINGTKYTGTNTIGIGTNSKKVLLTKTVDVPHNSNGTKSCSFAGTFYVGFTLSGTALSTVSTSGTGTFDSINVNSAPSLSGSGNINLTGTIPENTGNVTVSWPAASDAQNNVTGYRVYRYVNGQHTDTYWPGNVLSFTNSLSSFGENTSVYYRIWAYDSYDAYSGYVNTNTVTKNVFTGASFTGHSNDVTWETTSFSLYVDGAKNTNGNGTFTYEYYSDDVTVYNRSAISSKTGTISIWRDLSGGAQPSGMYIKQSDLKTKFQGSNYSGRLHVGVATRNSYGNIKYNGGSINVDLKTNMTIASGSTAISSGSYYSISGTNYLVPNRKQITLTWPKATDPLGTTVSYRIEQQVNSGSWTTLLSSTTSTSHAFNLSVSGKPTYAFRVIASNGYGRSATLSGTPSGVMYKYDAPSLSITSTSRTSSTLVVNFTNSISTEISNAIKSLTWSFPSANKSGTLTTTAKTFTITELTEEDSGDFTISLTDNLGATFGLGATVVTGSVSKFNPVLSIRSNGVGVGIVPTGAATLMVGGSLETKELNIKGYQQRNPEGTYVNQWLKIATLNVTGRYGDAGFTAEIKGTASGSNSSTNAQIVARLKQQNAMGEIPSCSLDVSEMVLTDAGCFTMVVVANTASITTAEVWFKQTTSYETAYVTPRHRYGAVQFHENTAYQTALPAGTQVVTTDRSSLTKNDLTGGNGNLYGKVMRIGTDGAMEAGKYLDFHDGDNGSDYNARITCQGSALNISGAVTAPSANFSSNPSSGNRVMIVNQTGNTSNHCPLLVETSGATNWGNTLEIRTRSSGGDRPTILFSSENTSRTYTIGMGEQSADGFTINYNHGIYGSGWGTNLLMVKPDWGMGLKQGWYRSWGNYGWYNETYGGGIYMSDSTWIRTWGSKPFYCNNTIKGNNFEVVSNGKIYSGYNGDYIIGDHGNGNVTLSGAGGQLYLGYRNTTGINVANTDFWEVGASSGANLKLNKAWSGSQGSEISIYNSKGTGWGFLGNENNKWFRVYGSGGSVSDRNLKYEITKASTEEQYENVKSLNIYNYRSISTENDNETNEVIKTFKRQDLSLGTMVDELPLETTFYDNEGGEQTGDKTVDMYSYTTMILGALKETIKKVESLEKELEELKNGNAN